MSKEKQIEFEMAEMLEIIENARKACANDVTDHTENEYIREGLLNANYRKQIEGEWVYKFTLDGDRFYECSVCGRQEVANCLCKERNLADDRPYCHCGAKMKGV